MLAFGTRKADMVAQSLLGPVTLGRARITPADESRTRDLAAGRGSGRWAASGNDMSTSERLRWGILGCARITRRGLIPGLSESSTGSLVALASRDLEKARAWSQEFGVPQSYGSYEELLGNPEIDVVYLPLPNEQHAPWIMRGGRRGQARPVREAAGARRGARRSNWCDYCQQREASMLMEAVMWRHQPRTLGLLKMRRRRRASAGLRLVRTFVLVFIEPGDWRLDPSRGGGALWDVGCYGVSAARLFTGAEPIDVQAAAHLGPTGVDMSLAALLRFPGDVLGRSIAASSSRFAASTSWWEPKGRSRCPRLSCLRKHPRRAGSGPTVRLREELVFDGRNQYACMVDAMGESLREGRRAAEAPAEDGRLQMEVLDTVREAAVRRHPSA